MSKRMSSTKCNYEIYDKKLFVIIKTFEKWRSKCVDTSIECSIKIFTNHQNLKYFMTSKNFNKKQTRWIEFLFEFNFVIIYRFDKQNTKFDNFTKKIENLSTNKNDERKKHNHKRLLKKKTFEQKSEKSCRINSHVVERIVEKNHLINCVDVRFEREKINCWKINWKINNWRRRKRKKRTKNFRRRHTSTFYESQTFEQKTRVFKYHENRNEVKIRSLWNTWQFFFWIKNKIYVSQNEKLYFVLIKLNHDFTMKNHANKKITYNRITRHYYWFKMTHTINRYVKICHQCKRTKTYRDAKQNFLNSLFISKKYFQNISMNFIMKLSKCVKNERIFEHIMIIMNKLFKKKKFIVLNSLKIKTIVQAFLK